MPRYVHSTSQHDNIQKKMHEVQRYSKPQKRDDYIQLKGPAKLIIEQ